MQTKHIVITGATSGIGLELVRQLYPENRLTVVGRISDRLSALRSEFPKLTIIEADLADLKAVVSAGKTIAKSDEVVDVLINNAAIQNTPSFLDPDFDLETIGNEIHTNLAAPALLISTLLPVLKKSATATILNINSGLALAPKTSSAVYCATKGGLNILSQSLAYQFERTNINVVQAFLPLVETRMTKGRGTGKLTSADAARGIVKGLASGKTTIDIGKVKLLRLIARLAPSIACKIMKRS